MSHHAHPTGLFCAAAQHEDLLNLVLGVLRSWNGPLYHLVAEVRGMREAPDAILSRAIEIEEQNKRLLEGMEKIVGQVSSPQTLLFLINERGDLWDGE